MNKVTYELLKKSEKDFKIIFPEAKKMSPCMLGPLRKDTDCSLCPAANYGLDCCNNSIKGGAE